MQNQPHQRQHPHLMPGPVVTPLVVCAIAGALVIGLATGCSPNGSKADNARSLADQTQTEPTIGTDPTNPAGHTSPTNLALPREQSTETAVLNAYQAFWQVWLSANSPPNPDFPELKHVAIGTALSEITASININKSNGTISRLPKHSHYRHRASFISLRDGIAGVADCAFDDGETIRAATGQVVNGDVMTQEILGSLRQVDGHWLVSELRIQNETPGENPCFAPS